MKTIILVLIAFIFFIGCASKTPIYTKSSTVIFKTPNMKFYDKGFIYKFDDHIQVQIFEVGHLILDMKIYKDEVCRSSLECISSKEFNRLYLHPSYKDDFLYELFLKNKIYHKDRKNNILIKVK